MEYKNNDGNVHCAECSSAVEYTWNYCPICGHRLPWQQENAKSESYQAVFVKGRRNSIYKRR